jgi:hypothetical protein
MRISDEDRHRVSEVLRRAAGEGRIDLAELDERLEATYQAKTYGDLVPLTADLPAAASPASTVAPSPQPPLQPVPHPAGYSTSVAVMSTSKRTGAWTVEDGHTAFALMGSVLLDLRDAHVGSREVTINASAVMGDVKVVVGAGARVVVDGFGIMGEFSEQRPKVPFDASAGGPLVRVRGIALMGSVHVQRKGRPGAGMLRRPGS